MSRNISLAVKNASAMNAYVATPIGDGPYPAVIVFHDAFGVNAHIRGIVDRLAREGFVAVAPDLFHRTAPEGFEARPYQVSLARPHVNALRAEHIDDDMQAIQKWVYNQNTVAEGKVGGMGFSLGGKYSFIANDRLKLAAGVSFYGSMLHTETARAANCNGPHLFVWAGKDEHISPEQAGVVTGAVQQAGKPHISITVAHAAHGFFFDGHPGHDPEAARETWAIAREFLKNKLKP